MITSIVTKEMVGINLTDNVLKLVYLKVSPSQKKVIGFKCFDTRVVADDDITKTIKDSLKEWKIRNTLVTLTISSPLIMTKNIEIPSLDQQEIKGIVDLQASRYTPYGRTEIILDYINIGVYKRNYTKLLLIIATRSAIKKPLDILNKADLRIDRVLLSSEGLGHFCSTALKLKSSDPPVAVIHIDADFSDFNVFFKNKIIFIRNISIGANHLLREREAYQAKFMEELKKSLETYQSEEIDQPPHLLVLTGNIEKLRYLGPLAKEHLHMPTKLLPYLGNVVVSDEAAQLASTENYSFLDTISPLIHAGKMKINLMPEEIRLRRMLENKSREIVTAGVLGIAIFVLIGCIFLSKIYYKSAYLKNLTSKYEVTNKEAQDIEKKFMKIRILKNYLLSAGKSLEILTEIHNIIPPNIFLQDITVEENGRVSIKGSSKSMSEVFSSIEKIEDSKYFQNVKTEYTKKRIVNDEDLTDFQISCVSESAK